MLHCDSVTLTQSTHYTRHSDTYQNVKFIKVVYAEVTEPADHPDININATTTFYDYK